ncbi:hypothetical protein M2263_001512 [Providencia alcalifaciens]|nr:hypothetical protein [Providencia alcalifaciens]
MRDMTLNNIVPIRKKAIKSGSFDFYLKSKAYGIDVCIKINVIDCVISYCESVYGVIFVFCGGCTLHFYTSSSIESTVEVRIILNFNDLDNGVIIDKIYSTYISLDDFLANTIITIDLFWTEAFLITLISRSTGRENHSALYINSSEEKNNLIFDPNGKYYSYKTKNNIGADYFTSNDIDATFDDYLNYQTSEGNKIEWLSMTLTHQEAGIIRRLIHHNKYPKFGFYCTKAVSSVLMNCNYGISEVYSLPGNLRDAVKYIESTKENLTWWK